MRRVIIDTNIYTSFMRKKPEIVEAVRHLDYIGIDITVIAECITGFHGGTREKQNRLDFESFCNSPRVHILDHTGTTAEFYAQVYQALKMQGTPIPTNDMWISAVALEYGLALFTLDKHFSNVPGLMLKTDF